MEVDVCIVGAGPAGAHLAIRLAAAGWRVALADAKRFPRQKPCGEFLSPECAPLLAEVGLGELLGDAGAHPIDGMRLSGYGRSVDGSYLQRSTVASGSVSGAAPPVGPGHGFALRREQLDHRTYRRAVSSVGVSEFAGHRFRALLRDSSGGVVGAEFQDPTAAPVSIRARFVVGADGLRSRVAEQLGVRRAIPWLDRFAIVARYPAVDDRRHAEVHFVDRAYLAVAPIDGGELTLNLVFDRAALPASRQELHAFLARHVAAAPPLAAALADRQPVGALQTYGPLAARTTRQVFDGAALVGDACGYVDPVTGEGLFFAMRGAALLAESLDRALIAGRRDAGALADYARRRRREFGPRFAMARLLQRGMRHPAVVRAFLAVLQARPRLADLLVTVTGDSVSPRELLDPRRLAWALRRAPVVA